MPVHVLAECRLSAHHGPAGYCEGGAHADDAGVVDEELAVALQREDVVEEDPRALRHPLHSIECLGIEGTDVFQVPAACAGDSLLPCLIGHELHATVHEAHRALEAVPGLLAILPTDLVLAATAFDDWKGCL